MTAATSTLTLLKQRPILFACFKEKTFSWGGSKEVKEDPETFPGSKQPSELPCIATEPMKRETFKYFQNWQYIKI